MSAWNGTRHHRHIGEKRDTSAQTQGLHSYNRPGLPPIPWLPTSSKTSGCSSTANWPATAAPRRLPTSPRRFISRPQQVANGLRALHTTRDLVLDDSGGIVLAHPFATRNFGFSVMGAATIW